MGVFSLWVSVTLSKIVLIQYLAQGILKSLSLSLLPYSEAWKKQKTFLFLYNVNIAQANFMKFIFSIKAIVAQLYRLRHSNGFPNTSNGLIFSVALSNSCSQMFFKIGVLKILEKFIRKHPCWSLFQNSLQTFRPATLLKWDSNTVVFL